MKSVKISNGTWQVLSLIVNRFTSFVYLFVPEFRIDIGCRVSSECVWSCPQYFGCRSVRVNPKNVNVGDRLAVGRCLGAVNAGASLILPRHGAHKSNPQIVFLDDFLFNEIDCCPVLNISADLHGRGCIGVGMEFVHWTSSILTSSQRNWSRQEHKPATRCWAPGATAVIPPFNYLGWVRSKNHYVLLAYYGIKKLKRTYRAKIIYFGTLFISLTGV